MEHLDQTAKLVDSHRLITIIRCRLTSNGCWLPACLQVQAAESLHHLASDGVRGTQLQLAAPSFQALITAWDHLAQRLPKQAGAQNAAGVILNALKLVFALSNSDSVQQSRDGTPAATPASTRTLALALQLADLAAQVCKEEPCLPAC